MAVSEGAQRSLPLVSAPAITVSTEAFDEGQITAPPMDETPARVSDDPIFAPAVGPPLDAGIFELGDVDVPPRLVERVDPVVSRRWFRRAESPARIELVVVIDRMGRVASASVHQTSDDALVAPSLKAVRLWRFSPASKGGKAVPVRIAVPLNFQTS